MKQGLYLAFVYIGLVIGAGFASGREIMEYFNIPSGRDHSGIVLATFLLIVICYMILRRAYLSDLSTCDEYLHAVAGRAARPGGVRALLAAEVAPGAAVPAAARRSRPRSGRGRWT